MKRTGPTNPELQALIQELQKESTIKNAPVWDRIAEDLKRPTRNRRVVNLSSLNRTTQQKEVILVPGKVLGSGSIQHPITIAAFAFSSSARAGITAAKGKCMTIPDLLKQNPKATNVRIIG